MLQIISLFTILLTFAYGGFLFAIVRSWKNEKPCPSEIHLPFPLISILIPARNEASSIRVCLNAILAQDYPTNRMEVIVIDDHSTDKTASIVKEFDDDRVRLLQLQDFLDKKQVLKAYKKAALDLGVKQAKGDFIITTDADCVATPGWLNTYARVIQEGKQMVLAPVKMNGVSGFLTAFQGLDVAGTMLLTGAAVFWKRPMLSNGANFGFSKKLFHSLSGYSGNEKQASGDDIFLLQKAVRQDVNDIVFLSGKEAIVQTEACKTWKELFWQRLRWAGKTSAYRDPYLIVFQALVFLLCCLLWVLPMAYMFGCSISLSLVLASWLIKAFSDALYLHYACRRLGEQKWMKWLVSAFFVHSFYIMLIGVLALLPIAARWKGR